MSDNKQLVQQVAELMKTPSPDRDRIIQIRSLACRSHGYLSAALHRMELRRSEAVDVMAASKNWVLYYNPKATSGCFMPSGGWIKKELTIGECAAIMVQQCWHLLREHYRRRGSRNALKYAVAAQLEINDSLDGLPLGSLKPDLWKFKDNLLAESYYEQLPDAVHGGGSEAVAAKAGKQSEPEKNDEQPEPEGTPGASQGSAATGLEQPWEEPRTDAPDKQEEKLLREYIAKEIQSAKSRGTVPAGLDRWATEMLKSPKLDLQGMLSSSLRRSIGLVRGRSDYTYSRPSRKPTEGFILPGMRGAGAVVAVIRDTSGSMGTDDINKAFSITQGVCRQLGAEPVVVDCDAAAVVKKAGAVKSKRMQGGGGTDMVVAIDTVLAMRPRPNLIVTVTDGYTPWPERIPDGVRHICVLTQSGGTRPKFGSVVQFYQTEKQ